MRNSKLWKALYFLILSVIIVFQSLCCNIAHAEDDLIMDMSYDPIVTDVKAGESIVYQLNLRVSGFSNSDTTNRKQLIIDIPGTTEGYTQLETNLNNLTIEGVKPRYEEATQSTPGRLVYDFDKKLETGRTYRLSISIKTKNGLIPHNSRLISRARFLNNGHVRSENSLDAIVKSETTGEITKKFSHVVGHENDSSYVAQDGDTVEWIIKAVVPNKSVGNAFLEYGSKIEIRDTIKSKQSYSTSDNGGVNRNGSVIWTFTAPTKDEQMSVRDSGNLWEKEVRIRTKISSREQQDTIFNKASLHFRNISGKQYNIDSNEASVLISRGKDNSIVNHGDYLVGLSLGPKNGLGEVATPTVDHFVPNPNPSVSGSAELGFSIQYRIVPGRRYSINNGYIQPTLDNDELAGETRGDDFIVNPYPIYDIERKGYNRIIIKRKIDPNLDIKTIEVGVPGLWHILNRGYKKMRIIPKTKISMVIFDSHGNRSVRNVPVKYTNLIPDKMYPIDAREARVTKLSREDLGLKPNERLAEYHVIFEKNGRAAIPGGFWENVHDTYTPKPGYYGKVTNTVTYDVITADGRHFERIPNFKLWNMEDSVIGPRTAVIVRDREFSPNISVDIDFEKKSGNVVKVEENVVKMTLKTNYPSPASAVSNMTASTLLPKGIRVAWGTRFNSVLYDENGHFIREFPDKRTSFEVIENFNNTGRQLIRAKWTDVTLAPKQYLVFRMHVDITKDVGKHFDIPVYASVGNKDFDVIRDLNNKITDSMDINGDNNRNDKLATTEKRFVLLVNNDLKIEKFVKGNLDNNFSKFGHATIGGLINYKLSLTNTTGEKIKKMGFIDILPSKDDLGIINSSSSRGSMFEPLLTGPIVLPEQWRDKVTVYYSRARNPRRDDLNGKVDYPAGISPIANPATAENPHWLRAENISESEWKDIHSFKIELNPNVEWIEGQNISVNFTMRAATIERATTQEEINSIFSGLGNERERAAWNSFAVTTNGLLPVEPERVGVAIAPRLNFKIRKKDNFGHNVTAWGLELRLWKNEVEGNERDFYSVRGINLEDGAYTVFQPADKAATENDKVVFVLTEEHAPQGYKKTNKRYYLEFDYLARTVKLIKTKEGSDGAERVFNTLLYDEHNPNQGVELEIINDTKTYPRTGGYGVIYYPLIGGLIMLVTIKIKRKNKQ